MTLLAETSPPQELPLCGRSSTLEQLYALLVAIRGFERSLLEMFDKGLLVGTIHTCLGQEATAVGVISAIDRGRDIVFTNHRGHGHFLTYSAEMERLYLEVMGKPGGICGGRGGSQHLHYRNFYSNGVQGGIVPVSTGMALAEKIKGTGAVTVVFLGDGTLGEGVVYESFNIASLWQIPVLFVIEDNGYAQSTPSRLQVAGSMRARPQAFGIPTLEHTTTDVREVLKLSGEVVDAVRTEVRPYCLLLHNYRLGPHSKGDDHRDAEELREAWERDPLRVLRGALKEENAGRIEAEILSLVEGCRERAMAGAAYAL
jgi:TPP-dependent pyruvate/acetoin dehydrogenase alpha subunit